VLSEDTNTSPSESAARRCAMLLVNLGRRCSTEPSIEVRTLAHRSNLRSRPGVEQRERTSDVGLRRARSGRRHAVQEVDCPGLELVLGADDGDSASDDQLLDEAATVSEVVY